MEKVDNLSVEPLNQTIYEFGIDIATSTCYIQFPEDIASLIGNGLYITYIKTDGLNGNIKAYHLDKFYLSTIDGVPVSSEYIRITNESSVIDGANEETIEEAYRNYKKTIGVFKTLVSLRDYTDYLQLSELCSNAIVSDKYSDIQDSWDIIKRTIRDTNQLLHKSGITTYNSSNIPVVDYSAGMSPFDLKFYITKYANEIKSDTIFKSTFDVESLSITDEISDYISEVKSISHTPVDIEMNRPIIIKNKYPY